MVISATPARFLVTLPISIGRPHHEHDHGEEHEENHQHHIVVATIVVSVLKTGLVMKIRLKFR